MSWLPRTAAHVGDVVIDEAVIPRLRRWLWNYVWGIRFALLAWLTAVVAAAYARDGVDAWRSLWWWMIGAVGLAVIFGVFVSQRLRPLRPAVLVARFQPVGAATDADADAIRQRVYEALAQDAGACKGDGLLRDSRLRPTGSRASKVEGVASPLPARPFIRVHFFLTLTDEATERWN